MATPFRPATLASHVNLTRNMEADKLVEDVNQQLVHAVRSGFRLTDGVKTVFTTFDSALAELVEQKFKFNGWTTKLEQPWGSDSWQLIITLGADQEVNNGPAA